MNDKIMKAVLAGVCFGLWPLFLNRSGLHGPTSSAIYALMVLVGVLPFALWSNGLEIPSAKWLMVVFAGIFGAAGISFFNDMLVRTAPSQVGSLFLVMIVAQITIPALYQIIMTAQLSFNTAVGIIFAIAAAFLLL